MSLHRLLHLLPTETAHRAALCLLRAGLAPRAEAARHPRLATRVMGIDFPNPLGLAAGFDKDAVAIAPALRMGFGFVETGTVTRHPQAGNPRPRVFRDVRARAVVNRMGFPGAGLEKMLPRLAAFRARAAGIVGVNVGVNKNSEDPPADYRHCVAAVAEYADYIVVNISSPNTAGLRGWQARAPLLRLLDGLPRQRPLLVKVAPDLDAAQREDVVAVALEQGIAGLVVGNTTLSRPAGLPPALAREAGGLSGLPLRDLALENIRDFRRLAGGRLALIGAGGIMNGDDAAARLAAGADLVQVYTGLVFSGPRLVPSILDALAARA